MIRGNAPIKHMPPWRNPIKTLATFVAVMAGWVFFRAQDLPQALAILRQMVSGRPGTMLLEPWHVGLVP